MSVQMQTISPQKRKKRNIYNVYCLFRSKQSFTIFQQQRNKPKSLQQLRKANQSQKYPVDLSQTKSKDEKQQKQEIQQKRGDSLVKDSVQSKKRCGKCMKLLLQQQNERGLCCQCVKMWKVIENGNFSKFIRFVIDFKKNKLPSFGKVSKVRRIESIQSCQSYTLDKAQSLSKHSGFRSKNTNRQSHRLKNSNSDSNRFKIGKISLGSLYKQSNHDSATHSNSAGGYFCNQCQISPIEGQRFHCLTCSDYDLCEKCYFYVGHKHQMKVAHLSRDQQIKKAKESVLMQSQYMKKVLPQLSQSIQKFESIPKLYTSYKIKSQS